MLIDTIVTDMDDTLLDGTGGISPFTLEVMHECTRRGIRVIPASGRTCASMRPFLQQLKTGCPAIGCNGAQQISADYEVLEEEGMSPDIAKAIIRFLEDEGFYVQVYHRECFYYAHECEPSLAYKKSSGMQGIEVGDLDAFLTFVTPKVLSVNHPDEVQRVLPLIQAQFGAQAVFTLSKPYFIEALPPNVSKGNALKKLAARIGIDPDKTLVFGDSLNDISMFGFTKNSVAMGNARAEAKQAAHCTCLPNTQDGLAHFVKQHVLDGTVKETML